MCSQLLVTAPSPRLLILRSIFKIPPLLPLSYHLSSYSPEDCYHHVRVYSDFLGLSPISRFLIVTVESRQPQKQAFIGSGDYNMHVHMYIGVEDSGCIILPAAMIINFLLLCNKLSQMQQFKQHELVISVFCMSEIEHISHCDKSKVLVGTLGKNLFLCLL